jgi:hypothetical protein
MLRHFLHRKVILIGTAILMVSCSESDTLREPLVNEYEIDLEKSEITTNMYWEEATESGEADQIRLMEPIRESSLYDLVILSPVPGPAELEGTYIFSKTGDIGTYNLIFVHATDGLEDYEWYTNGDIGDVLSIELEGKENGQKIYRLVISNFTLNYGYWDYLAGKWVSEGQKQFKISYQGPIETRSLQ